MVTVERFNYNSEADGSAESEGSLLREGISPILVSVGGEANYSQDFRELNAEDIDLYADPAQLDARGILHEGYATYVISPVDAADKQSTKFINCTGLVVIGVESATGDNISLLTHQYSALGEQKQARLMADIESRLTELRDRCEEGTIDAAQFGGNFVSSDPSTQRDYEASMRRVSELVQKALGFIPTIIVGPKLGGGADSVLLDTEHRRLYLSRDARKADNTSFTTKDFTRKKDEWLRGN